MCRSGRGDCRRRAPIRLFFAFWPEDAVRTALHDAREGLRRRRTRFLALCPSCGNYREVIGAKPLFLKVESTHPLCGFYRTDVALGGWRAKSHSILVSSPIKAALQAERLCGLDFHEAYAADELFQRK
jgi:hypothetical protein